MQLQTDLFGNIIPKNKYFNLNSVRERGISYGSTALNDAELIMALLGVDIEKATNILDVVDGMRGLVNITIEELTEINGIGKSKAITLKAAIEIGQRISKAIPERQIIKSPEDVADLVMEDMRYLDREYFKLILLNNKNHVLSIETITIGILNSSVVHPREAFKVAIKKSAAAIILLHNHPSGDPTPSREDLEVTKRLEEAGKIIGIDVIDHVIIGDGRFVSFKAKGLL